MDMDEKLRCFLGKIGLVGLRSGLARDAVVIFQGLAALHPERSGPVIGLAMAYLADDRFTEAAALLEHLPDPEAKLYLGMAYRLLGRADEAVSMWTALAEGEGETAMAARSFLLVNNAGTTSRFGDFFKEGRHGT